MPEQRAPRLHDPGYLAWLRLQPCACGCGRAPCDAAHLRSASLKHGKPLTGLGRKPNDCWALPLYRGCHMRQHDFGDEQGWWAAQGVRDPFALAKRYYALFDGRGGKPRARRAVKARRPHSQRGKIKSARKIPSRPFPKQRRAF